MSFADLPRTAAGLGVIALLAACSSAPEPAEPGGRGIVTIDERPPDGARVWGRPDWALGDRFVYRRGGLVDVAFRVTKADADGYELEEETTGLLNQFTRDLWIRGQTMAGDASMDRSIDPSDPQLTWPLWVGKRWVAHFVRSGGPGEIPVLAQYECDAVETLNTAAGPFECLRIWRRTKPAIEERYFERNDLLWYAPGVGFFARKLEDGMLTELQEVQRSVAGGGGPGGG